METFKGSHSTINDISSSSVESPGVAINDTSSSSFILKYVSTRLRGLYLSASAKPVVSAALLSFKPGIATGKSPIDGYAMLLPFLP